MRTKFGAFLFVLLLFAVTAMIVGSVLDFIPWNIRRWGAFVVIPVAVLWFLWSWFKWHAKQRGDQNELDCLKEVVQEHERGVRDNSKTIREQIFFIERDHEKTTQVVTLRTCTPRT